MINNFTGRYRFLSNFVDAEVKLDGEIYKSVEHAYQAAKTHNVSERKTIQGLKTASEAKRYGRDIFEIRRNWDEIKLVVMEDLLRQKFADFKYRLLLVETGDEDIIEGNYWHDNFWGVCTCKNHSVEGLNHLGKLLMKIRQEILNERNI